MANITRIKNNQITDSTITYSKIAPGTLVGSVFNPNLTLNSNVTIVGNLSITGTPTTIQSTNTYVNDPLIVFNNGYVGTPSYDIGIIANRNLQSLAGYGSVNVGWIWEESAGQWQAIATTETGATAGTINNSGWSNVRVGNLVSVSSNVTGALTVGGAASITGTTNLVGATTFSTATGGGLQVAAIGNVTPGSGAFTSLLATGGATFSTVTAASVQAVIGNVTPNSGAFTTLTASGATTLTNSTASSSTSTGALVVTGGVGVSGALYAATVFDNGNRVVTGLTSSGSGNLTVGGTAPTLTVALPATGPGASTWGGPAQIPSITVDAYGRVSTAGNTALATVAVTNLGNTSEITSNASVGLVGLSLTTTGVVAGNYGSTTSIPTIVVDSKGRITSITTNAISSSFTVAGTSGSTTVSNGNTLTLAGTYGVTVSVGSTYANIATPQDLQATANPTFNNLTTASVQGVIGNVTPAAGTFTTVTAQTETVGGLQAGAIGNVTPGTGAFTTLTAQTETVGGLQAAAIGNVTPGTGAFTNLTASGTLGVTGATTLTTATVGGLQAVAIGNVTPGSGAFTTGTFSSTLGVTGATTLTTATVGGLQAVAIGNVTPGSGAFTTLSASGPFTITSTTESTNATTGALIVSGGVGVAKNLNVGGNVVITGNLTVQGDVTTLNTSTLDVEDLNITVAKGAASAAAANGAGLTVDGANATLVYTSASDSWDVNKLFRGTKLALTDTTDSTNLGSGAMIVAGGASINKNLNVGGYAHTGQLYVSTTAAGGVATFDAATYGSSFINLSVANATYSSIGAAGGILIGAINNYDLALQNQTAIRLGIGVTPILNVTSSGISVDGLTYVQGALTATGATTLTTATTGGLQAVAIGNVTPGTGAFTSLTAGSFQGVIGNVTPNTGAFTTLTAGSFQGVIGNVTPAAGTFTTLTAQTETVGGLQAVAIGNVTPGSGAFTTLSATGTTTLNTVTGASFQGIIGNVTPAAGTFTNLTATGTVTLASINNTPIGNATPSTGAFTTLSASTWANITATTASTNNSTGALLVAGGVGIQGNLSAGSSTSYHRLGGNLLLGNPQGGFSGTLTTLEVNQNPDAPQMSTSVVHVSSKSGFTGKITIDSFGTGTNSMFVARTSRGTSASPTAVQSGDYTGGYVTRGYGATGYSINTIGNSAGLVAKAAENFTDTAQGQTLFIQTVKTGSNVASVAMRFDASGNIIIPGTEGSINPTDGALVVAGGIGVGANVNVGGNLTVSNFISGNSGLQVAGKISTLSVTDTTAPGIGSIVTPGGLSVNGNAYVGNNLYVGPAAFNTDLTTPTVFAVDNGGAFAQMAIKNTAETGSADFSAYGANGTDAAGWADMGFTGNAFNDGNYTITKPNDGYFIVRPASNTFGGNLVLATSESGSYNDVVIGVGSFHSNAEVVRFHGNASNNGTMVVKLPTNAVPAANTGAFQVWGGTSISGNSYVGGAMTINGSQTANYDFTVKGKLDNTLVWARPGAAYDQVVIGGNATPAGLNGGAKLTINSTDSLLLPTGTTGQRPSAQGYTDVQGMFRFNTTLGAIEWYTGALWQTVSTTFTIITDEQFNGDGTTVDFTLGGSTTTAGTIVSINGVVQIPTLAYSITGAGNTTLTFTEAPAVGDVIDVRRLTTTQTLFGVASPNGKMAFQTDNNGVYIYTGPTGGTSTATTSWDANGYTIRTTPNVTIASANVATTIMSIDTTKYRSSKMVVQATSGTNYQVSEAIALSNGTTATIVNYGTVQTNGNVGIITATQSGGNVLVQFTAVNSGTIVKVVPDLITI